MVDGDKIEIVLGIIYVSILGYIVLVIAYGIFYLIDTVGQARFQGKAIIDSTNYTPMSSNTISVNRLKPLLPKVSYLVKLSVYPLNSYPSE